MGIKLENRAKRCPVCPPPLQKIASPLWSCDDIDSRKPKNSQFNWPQYPNSSTQAPASALARDGVVCKVKNINKDEAKRQCSPKTGPDLVPCVHGLQTPFHLPPPFFFFFFSFSLLSLPSPSLLNPVIDLPAASSRYTRTVVGLDRYLPSSSTPSGRVRIDVPVKNTFLLPLPQSRRARGIPVTRRWALALSVCISGSRGIVPVLVLVPVPALTLAFVLGQASLDQHMPLETKSAHVADRQPKKKKTVEHIP